MSGGREPALRALAELREAELERAIERLAAAEQERARAEEATERARVELERHAAESSALLGELADAPISAAELGRREAFRARRREEAKSLSAGLERAASAQAGAERAVDEARAALARARAARELVAKEEARRARAEAARGEARLEDELAEAADAKRRRR